MVRSGLVLGAVALLAACGQWPGTGDTDTEAGMGVPQQRGSEEYAGQRRSVEPHVHLLRNGCFLGSLPDSGTDQRWLVVWPRGTEQGDSGVELRLPDGTTVHDGDVLAGDGLLVRTRALPGFGEPSYWESTVGYCTPGASKVLVLDSAEAASR